MNYGINALRKNSKFESKEPPVVLITGCGSGLGYALTKLLYEKSNFRVIATARSAESVAKLRGEFHESERFKILELDIVNQIQRDQVVAGIFSMWKSIDVLINNAGISYRSVIEHMDEESELKQLEVNYLSPLAIIRLVIPSMREKGFGKIINVSSVSGMVAMPTMASYSASKHALEGATEALWYELRPFGISVSLVQPGFIKSNSFEKVYYSQKAKLSQKLEGPYADYYSNMDAFIKKLMHKSTVSPEQIAMIILNLIKEPHPPLWVPVTPDAKLFFWIRKILPRRIFHRFMFLFLPNVRYWGGKYIKSKSNNTHNLSTAL